MVTSSILLADGSGVYVGWIVTYIIDERGGNSSSGYISSGYWGGGTVHRNSRYIVSLTTRLAGLTLGRIALIWFSNRVSSTFREPRRSRQSDLLTTSDVVGWRVARHLRLRHPRSCVCPFSSRAVRFNPHGATLTDSSSSFGSCRT